MRKPIHHTAVVAALAVSALFAGLALADSQPFKVTLPPGFGDFAKSSQTAKSPSGKNIQVTNWVWKSPTGEAIVVSVTKLWAKIADPDKQIASNRDSLLKSVNGTIDSEQKVDGPNPGIRVDFHSGGAFLRARFTVKGDSLYQLLYVGRTAEQRNNPTVDTLFQSFAIESSESADAMKPAAVASSQ